MLIVPLLNVIDFIQNHIKEEQQLEAIKYICALELVDNFPLVTLLNDHLKNSKRKAEDLCKEGNKSLPVQVFFHPLLFMFVCSSWSNVQPPSLCTYLLMIE